MPHAQTPPTTPPKPKKSMTTRAVLLAVLLHLGLAVIAYFVWSQQHAPMTSHPSDGAIHNASSNANTTDSLEAETLDNTNAAVSSTQMDTTNITEVATNAAATNFNTNATENRVDTVAAGLEGGSEDNSTMATDITDATPNHLPNNQPDNAFDSPSGSDSDNLPTMMSNPNPTDTRQARIEYNLQQSQEYQELEEEVDDDNEQLAKLINQVKARNQSQIQQHQQQQDTANIGSLNSAEPQLVIDYPVTAIQSPSDNQPSSDNQSSTPENISPITE